MVAWPTMRAVERAIARLWGEGGSLWGVIIPTGDGVTEPAAPTITASWVGDVVQAAYPTDGTAVAATPAENLPYTATGDTPLPPRCEIVNGTGHRYAIGVTLHSEGYYQYRARRLADASPAPALTPMAPGMGAALSHTWTTDYGL